jgi:hypothetical protein
MFTLKVKNQGPGLPNIREHAMKRAAPAPGRPSRARRRRRAFLAPVAQLTAALALAGQAHAAVVTTPIVSGLPWRSGATTSGFPCLADLRGRPLDAQNLFVTPPSFDQMVTNTGT